MSKTSIRVDDPVFKKWIIIAKINTLQNYLGNKKVMYDILSNDKRSFNFLPLTVTFKLTDNYSNFINYVMNYSKDKRTWILKPAVGLQGNDILISSSPGEVINYINSHNNYTEWVLSEYIDNPFLLKINGRSSSGAVFKDSIGRKTHIRIYVLITKIDNVFHIYLYKDNLIFCAVKEYSGDDISDRFSNLTNLHLGSMYYDEVLKIDGTMAYKDLSFPLKKTVNKIFGENFYSEVVYPQIKNMLTVILDNSVNYLKCDKMNQGTRGCFQYIAIDIMPDDKFHLHLLEINGSPGLNAPFHHWKNLDKFAESILSKTSDFINKKENKVGNGFILIK